MPLFRKKNKFGPGAAPKESSQTKGSVRPLSGTFGSSINHLDEEDVIAKKPRCVNTEYVQVGTQM